MSSAAGTGSGRTTRRPGLPSPSRPDPTATPRNPRTDLSHTEVRTAHSTQHTAGAPRKQRTPRCCANKYTHGRARTPHPRSHANQASHGLTRSVLSASLNRSPTMVLKVALDDSKDFPATPSSTPLSAPKSLGPSPVLPQRSVLASTDAPAADLTTPMTVELKRLKLARQLGSGSGGRIYLSKWEGERVAVKASRCVGFVEQGSVGIHRARP